MNSRKLRKVFERLSNKAVETFKIGQVWEWYPNLSESHPNRRMVEIRAIVDDDQVVTRRWLERRGHMEYNCTSAYEMGSALESGVLVLNKK